MNAAVALRARPSDFDDWAAHGLGECTFDEVLQTCRALENTPTGDDEFHGRSGPLPIRERSYAELAPSLEVFIDASDQHGLSRLDDFNADKQYGVAPYLLTAASRGAAEHQLGVSDRVGSQAAESGGSRKHHGRQGGAAWWRSTGDRCVDLSDCAVGGDESHDHHGG